ncbi:PTS sorbitol transporter subunit IIA [Anaerococcus sp. WCA-380-WT-2B]|uniref:PTS sorbitol transporter subunit IIA n=1 Tax=Anaerococcus porci TaxID=2652269 RepID=A0A6N7VGW6_9FIRM|nr:PTS glucitol/sorbitol transporter subunit IIA [Anaerococcus porci]MSS78121.1 PTS sorbitol transporter subunit IIA [Anaerococcus porci]
MKTIYENKVKAQGDLVEEFGSVMLIFFGDNAPDTLKDYCHLIDIKKVDGEIKVGDYFEVDGLKAKILAVGEEAQRNLENLGHLTVNLSANVEDLLPGAIVCESLDIIKVEIGSEIKIVEE